MRSSALSRPVASITAVLVAVAGLVTFPLAGADSGAGSSLEGRLLVELSDFGRALPQRVNVSLRTASAEVPLRVAATQATRVRELAGLRVRAFGRRTQSGFDAFTVEPATTKSAPSVLSPRLASARHVTRVAVVLMRRPGSRATGVTKRQAEERFFGRARGQSSVGQWFAEASGGQASVTGKVFGYYGSSLPPSDCRLSDWLRAARTAMTRDGYSPGRFDHLVVYTPGQDCPFKATSYVGSSGVYLNGTIRQTVAEHELSHNLGLWNAGAYSCQPSNVGCLAERGDPVDIMGNASTNRHYSAVHKYMLGWIPPSEVRSVSDGTATIALTASEHPMIPGSTELILVRRGDGASYAVDRRESFGHDHGLSGVWVRIVDRVGTTDTQLPASKPLPAGQSFVDAANGVTITTLSDSGPTASVRVCAGSCGNGGPTTTSTSTTTSTTLPPPTTTQPPPQRVGGAAANREIMWARCKDVVALTDAQLDAWRARGIGGFVCMNQLLAGMGGAQEFTADPAAALAGPRYDLQRKIRDTRIVSRAAARGIKLWIGIYLSNYYNHTTPLEEWFDDAEWSTVLNKLGDIAGAARMLGFQGLAFDEEQYYGGTWKWTYPGNTHTEAEVRAEVRARGTQMMRSMVSAFPGIELLDYATYFPEGWNALVQQQVNHTVNPYADFVQIDLWDGLTRAAGYGAIRFVDATFYKTAHLNRATWDAALSYNINGLMAYLSRHLSNWSYAAAHVNISPFAWIDGDIATAGAFSAPHTPAYVADQLAAFRRWGMGGAFAIYSYLPLGKFDYTPYTAGMQAASQPGTVDQQPPAVTVDSARRSAGRVVVTGTATDDRALGWIDWAVGGAGGAAPMTWAVTGGGWTTGYQWHMSWSATITAAPGQRMTFIAHDSSGNTAATSATAP